MNRQKHGWRRVINGVNLAALLVVLFIGLALNWFFNPTLQVFRQADATEYILLAKE